MPLSEHEQRLLDQIERALYAEDPKFASVVRTSDLKTHLRRRVRRAAVLLVLGLAVLVVGVAVPIDGVPTEVVGGAGFVIMLGAGLVLARTLSRMAGRDLTAATEPRRERRSRGAGRASGPTERGGLLGRVEERWRQRWEDGDR